MEVTMPKTFEQILSELAVPFHSTSIEWKPQALSADKKRALAAAYVDMRDYEDRLDKVFPQWTSSVQFVMTEKKVAAIVSLTIAGITRVNVGEASLDDENAFTTAYAQGFKRACSDFGLGRYLYRLPQVWCDYDEKRHMIISAPELPDWARHPDEVSAPEVVSEAVPAEAAAAPPEAMPSPQEEVIPFGRYKGKRLGEVDAGWLKWLAQVFRPRTPAEERLQAAAREILESEKPAEK
jgi:hypothetical protein